MRGPIDMPQDSPPQQQTYMLWRQTHHQHRIATEGRNRPPPSIGSPAIVWHLGIWRKHDHAKGQLEHATYFHQHEYYTSKFYEEISQFLVRLQSLGLCTTDVIRPIC